MDAQKTKDAAEQQFELVRVFDAPRALVWKMWTDPEHFKRWWGPRHFTCPVAELDVRPGGKYLHCMRSEGGQEYWGTGNYIEVVPQEKLVYTDSFGDKDGNKVPSADYGMPNWPDETTATIRFEDADGGKKTKVTLSSNVSMAQAKEQGAPDGWGQSLDKLAEVLAKDVAA
jgi:uncharacterized protein YndB with AHSA1/START domain